MQRRTDAAGVYEERSLCERTAGFRQSMVETPKSLQKKIVHIRKMPLSFIADQRNENQNQSQNEAQPSPTRPECYTVVGEESHLPTKCE